MGEYTAGTVWLEVSPSFDGLQNSLKRAVRDGTAGIDKDMDKSFEKAGKSSGKKFGNALGDEIGKTVKKAQEQVGGLAKNLKPDELKDFQKILKDIQKTDLSKTGNLDRATKDLNRMRNSVQGVINEYDAGTRRFSSSTRTNIGALRDNLDGFRNTVERLNRTDPAGARAAQQQQAALAQQLRAQREMTTEIQRRGQIQDRANAENEAFDQRRLATAARASRENDEFDARRQRAQQRLGDMQTAAYEEDRRRRAQATVDAAKDLQTASRNLNQASPGDQNYEELYSQAREAHDRLEAEFANVDVEFNVDEQALITQARRASEAAARAASDARIEFDAEIDRSHLAALREDAQREMSDIRLDIHLGDTEEARSKMRALRAELDRRIELRIDVDGTLRAIAQLEALNVELERVEMESSRANRALGRFNPGSAANAVRVFNGGLLATVAIGPLLIPVLAGLTAGFAGLAVAAGAGILGLGVGILGLVGIGGALKAMSAKDKAAKSSKGTDKGQSDKSLIGDQRSIADAQKALARAKAAAAASIKADDEKIKEAEQGVTQAEKDAARASQDAAEKVKTAQQGLVDARQKAAKATQQALAQVKSAEASLTAAQTNAWQAQKQLNAARKQAARDLQDMNNQLKDAQLSEQQSKFGLEDAGASYNAVLEDPQATEREKAEAKLAYEQAQQQYKEQQLATKRLASDTADANKAGVEGSATVTAAQQQVIDANDAVAASEQAIKDARQAVADQAQQNAKDIADAEKAVADARQAAADQQVQNAKDIADAEKSLGDARQDRADQVKKNAETIGDAQLALSRAYQDAALDAQNATDSTDSLTTANDNLADAMGKLSPAGQKFATFLYGLKPLLDQLKFAAQESFLPGLQAGLQEMVTTYGPGLVKFIGSMGKVLGDLAKDAADLFTSPWWQEFFSEVAAMAPQFLKLLGSIGLSLLTVFAGLGKAFAPLGLMLTQWLAKGADKLAKWAMQLSDSKGFKSFLAYVQKEGPKIGKILGLMFDLLLKALEGLAPYADKLLDFFITLLTWLDSMDPKTIGAITVAILGIIGAIQLLAGPMALIQGLVGLFSGIAAIIGVIGVAAFGWIALIVAGVIAVIAVVVLLYNKWDWFHRAVNKWFDIAKAVFTAYYEGIKAAIIWVKDTGIPALVTAFQWLNTNVIQPLGAAFKWLWDKAIHPALKSLDDFFHNVIVPTIQWFYKTIVKPTFVLIGGVITAFWDVAKVALDAFWQIFKYVIWPIIKWFYKEVVKPYFGFMGSVIKTVWHDTIKPVLSALGDFISDHVAPAFKAGVGLIGDLWGGLLDLLRAPIRLGIKYVINDGLIGAFNWLAGKVPGMTKIDPVKIPNALQPGGKAPATTSSKSTHSAPKLATGGVLPGYTPGADVHHFTSPTAGTLDLSGGEGILRPEAVRMVGGAPGIAHINAVATGRRRGLAGGGVVDWFGDRWDDVKGIASGAWKTLKSAKNAVTHPVTFLKDVITSSLGKMGLGDGPIPQAIAGIATAPLSKIGDLVKGALGVGGGSSSASDGKTPAAGAPASGGIGWQAQEAIIKAAFPNESFSSALRPGARTTFGNLSMHALGRAIDIVPPNMDVFNWLSKSYPNSSELLYSPAGDRQIQRGAGGSFRGDTSGALKAMHYNHVHWAMKNGGVMPTLYDTGGDVPPGLSLVANKTRKPEVTLTNKFVEDVRNAVNATGAGGNSIDMRGSQFGYDPHEVGDAIERKRKDKQALLSAGSWTL